MSSHAVAQSYKQQKDSPLGVWDLKGLDSANTEWIATVVLTQAMDGARGGYIDWLGDNGHSGREYITASFNGKTRLLKMIGTQVVFSKYIVRANYSAELSPDGLHLINGSWSDEDPAIPGTWSAIRIACEPVSPPENDSVRYKQMLKRIEQLERRIIALESRPARAVRDTQKNYDLTSASDFVRKHFDGWKTEVHNNYLLENHEIKEEHVLEGETGAVAYVWFATTLENVQTHETSPFEAVYFLYRWRTDQWEGIFNTDGTKTPETEARMITYRDVWLPKYLGLVEQGHTNPGGARRSSPVQERAE